MRGIIYILWLSALFASCTSPEREIRRMEQQMLLQLPLLFADEVLPVVFTPELMDSIGVACAAFRAQTHRISQRRLKPVALASLDRANEFLTQYETLLQTLRTDPSYYNLGGYLKTTLAQEKTPLYWRMPVIKAQMLRSGPYYAAARRNLSRPDPGRARIAVQKHLLTMEFLEGELRDSVSAAGLDPFETEEILGQLYQTRLEVKDYLAFCRSIIFEHRDSTNVPFQPGENR